MEKETFGDEDELLNIVLEAGAEDMKAEDDVFEISAAPEDFSVQNIYANYETEDEA